MRIITVILFLSFFQANAQLEGKVTDAKTGESLPGVNLRVLDSKSGTFTNENGEFSLFVHPKQKIVLSYIGYKTDTLEVTKKYQNLFLHPISFALNEVSVNNSGLAYLIRAQEKGVKNKSNFFEGYLKYTGYEGKELTCINEVLFKAKHIPSGIEFWLPTNSRYAVTNDQNFINYFSNAAAFYRTAIVFRGNSSPTSYESDKSSFSFKILKWYKNHLNQNLVEIAYISKTAKAPYYKGTVTINTDTDNILAINETFYQKKEGNNIAKNQSYNHVVTFNEDKNGMLHFNSLVYTELSTVKGKKLKKTNSIHALNTLPEIDQKILRSVQSTHSRVVETNYEPTTWQLVKYTTSEDLFLQEATKMKNFKTNF